MKIFYDLKVLIVQMLIIFCSVNAETLCLSSLLIENILGIENSKTAGSRVSGHNLTKTFIVNQRLFAIPGLY